MTGLVTALLTHRWEMSFSACRRCRLAVFVSLQDLRAFSCCQPQAVHALTPLTVCCKRRLNIRPTNDENSVCQAGTLRTVAAPRGLRRLSCWPCHVLSK